MLAQSDASTMAAVDRSLVYSHERDIETRVLLQAVTALRHEGILSDAEYEAKRRRLAAQV